MSIWFTENQTENFGITMKVNRTLHVEQTEFQKLDMIETEEWGNMLLLDDMVMTSQRDEFVYHEMVAHVPLFTHPNPENILVVGGGDGGAIREVLKHPSVKKATLVDIDGKVIEYSKKFLPEIAGMLDDPRVDVQVGDGFMHIAQSENEYDVIMVDSSDPIGPAEVLFSEEFYVAMKKSLRADGIAVTQSESFYYHGDIVKRLTGYAKKHYAVSGYYFTVVPTYPSGTIGFTFCSKKYHPLADLNEARAKALEPELTYYNAAIHRGSFALPNFISRRIDL